MSDAVDSQPATTANVPLKEQPAATNHGAPCRPAAMAASEARRALMAAERTLAIATIVLVLASA